MNLERERELFLRHSHFEFLMQYVDWDGRSWVFKESNSLQDTQNYYKDYLHFVDCWSYWLASASRNGYKLVPVDTLKAALDWMNCVESEWEGAADLTEDYKHRDIIEQSMLGAVE